MDIYSIFGLALGVFFWFMVFDTICVKLWKVGEVRAVWYSFILLVLFFIVYALFDNATDSISNLIIRLVLSALFLIMLIIFAKKDEKEKTRLLNLPDDANINLGELAIISNKSEKKLKKLVTKNILSTIQHDDGKIHFNKGKALNELKTIDEQ